MRRSDRERDAAFALEVLDKAPFVTVSMTREDGTLYGLPLSLARTGDKTFYFHCALEERNWTASPITRLCSSLR